MDDTLGRSRYGCKAPVLDYTVFPTLDELEKKKLRPSERVRPLALPPGRPFGDPPQVGDSVKGWSGSGVCGGDSPRTVVCGRKRVTIITLWFL